jgi:hypothetical protein
MHTEASTIKKSLKLYAGLIKRLYIFPCLIFSLTFSCKKPVHEKIDVPNPLESPDTLGVYTTTEIGDSTLRNPSISYITGYTDKRSYYPGDTVKLYLTGPAGKSQPLPLKDINGNTILQITADITEQKITTKKPWLEGDGFSVSATYVLPLNIKSGVYFWNGRIPCVIKGQGPYDVTIVYPTNTINAYCQDGGKSLYYPAGQRALVTSFLRIQEVNAAYTYTDGFLKWMNNQVYRANYVVDEDLDDYNSIENSRLLIIAGHSEYWTRKARENFDKFVDKGGNALILSGNTMWWQVRYNKKENLMICYKNKDLDPLANTLYASTKWTDTTLKFPTITSIGTDFARGGYAQYGSVLNTWDGYKITGSNSPLFEGTNLKNGDTLHFSQFECDGSFLVKDISLTSTEIPVLDKQKYNYYKSELLAYNYTYNAEEPARTPSAGTFVIFQKKTTSGVIVNTSSETWCLHGYSGQSQNLIKTITENMIDKSLSGAYLFSK